MANLQVTIVAPTADRAVGQYGATVATPERQVGRNAPELDASRGSRRFVVADGSSIPVAEAPTAATPTTHVARAQYRTGMVIPSGDEYRGTT
jgi:hypothetical protein